MYETQVVYNGDEIDQTRRRELLEEYKEASADMRHQNFTRFLQLTTFAALNSGLLYILFCPTVLNTIYLQMMFATLGLIITRTFYILDYRSAEYWIWAVDRAKEIEAILNFRRFSRGAPPSRYGTARRAAWFLYYTAATFWILYIVVVLIENIVKKI